MPSSQICVVRGCVLRLRRGPSGFTPLYCRRPSSSIPKIQTVLQDYERSNHLRSSIADGQQQQKSRHRPRKSKHDTKSVNGNETIPDITNIRGTLEETLEAHQKDNESRLNIIRLKTISKNHETFSHLHERPKSVDGIDFKHLNLKRARKRVGVTSNEYDGQSQPLLARWQPSSTLPGRLRYPWIRHMNQTQPIDIPAMEYLKEEIKAVATYLSPTVSEEQAAKLAIEEIRGVIHKFLPSTQQVNIIGSRANGLANPLSDIDLNLGPSTEESEVSSERPVRRLSTLGRWLQFRVTDPQVTELVKVSYFTSRAKLPLIAAVHLPTGLEFQVQCTTSAYGSLEFCKGLTAEFPTLKALFLLLKHLLNIRGLCYGSYGGITSYPLLNMIVTSLKLHAASTDPTDVSRQLLQFLEFFSRINFYETGISYRPSSFLNKDTAPLAEGQANDWDNDLEAVAQDPVGAIPVLFNVCRKAKELNRKEDSYMMTLLDPTNLHNDLGKAALTIKHVQATFIDMYEKLSTSIDEWDRRTSSPDDDTSIRPSLLVPLIGADYSLFVLDRQRLSSFGEVRSAIEKP